MTVYEPQKVFSSVYNVRMNSESQRKKERRICFALHFILLHCLLNWHLSRKDKDDNAAGPTNMNQANLSLFDWVMWRVTEKHDHYRC